MKQFRELPRYDVTHLRGFIVTMINDHKVSIPIRNVSLGGLQVICNQELYLNDEEVEIHLIEKKPFLIKIYNVWKITNEDNKYQAGFRFQFKDVRSFQRWLQVMKALHLHKSKKKN